MQKYTNAYFIRVCGLKKVKSVKDGDIKEEIEEIKYDIRDLLKKDKD